MDTLTPLHDELDASLNRILDRIDTQVLEARWRLGDMYWEKDYWLCRSLPIIDSSSRSWQEQVKLREKYLERKGINYALPGEIHPNSHRRGGGAIDFGVVDEIAPQRLSDLLSGHAFGRVLGNKPWHFEFTPDRKSVV